MRRLEKAEGNISKLFLVLQRAGSREEFEAILKDTQEVIQDAKALPQNKFKKIGIILSNTSIHGYLLPVKRNY